MFLLLYLLYDITCKLRYKLLIMKTLVLCYLTVVFYVILQLYFMLSCCCILCYLTVVYYVILLYCMSLYCNHELYILKSKKLFKVALLQYFFCSLFSYTIKV